MVVPRRDRIVVSHDGYRKTEEKGATPDPLMGVCPFGYPLDAEDEKATMGGFLASLLLGFPRLEQAN